MKEFKEYYSRDKIIKYLCKIRISYARKRYKINLLDNLTSKEYFIKEIRSEYDENIIKELKNILPSRRMWLTSGQRTHEWVVNNSSGLRSHIKISTDEKNKEILFKTTRKYVREKPNSEFVIKLNEFIKDIQESIENNSYTISEPDILPEVKEKSKYKLDFEKANKINTECRPISRFSLKDRIILSITNKFLTELFDDFFEDSSFAFRAVKEIDGKVIPITHHMAIDKIIENKRKYENIDLYVAECDMKKFYDSVNHKVCFDSFNSFILKAKSVHPTLDLTHAITIFNAYLKCYSFRENVLTKNSLTEYWFKQIDIKGNSILGYYPWIEKEIENSNYYNQNKSDRIGVPQGGALSGLIANLVLDIADKKLKEIENIFYIRYCDDMILMHVKKDECKKAIELYKTTINHLHLFNHDFKNKFFEKNKNFREKCDCILESHKRIKLTKNNIVLNRSFKQSIKPFWGLKSKGPYKWGKLDLKINSFPWIGFVGYEIHYKGETRIRQKSLKKEIAKQERVVSSITYAIKNDKRARNNAIIKSAYEKLNGMSVGRIKLYNYETCKNSLCWTNGFQSLTLNKYSKKQLKTLDRNKYKYIHLLKKQLKEESVKPDEFESENNEEIYFYHKPFSYYYQAGEKKDINH